MAICKEKISNSGVATNYHRISNVLLDGSDLDCSLESYVSAEYRAKNRPAERKSYTFQITVEEEESMGIRALCYSKIKELEEWKDAKDC